jgi:transcriptional regulator with XRE-family HTH domain
MARKNQYIKQVDQLIGGKISSLRLAKDYTRRQLADLIEVTHQQLQKYEKGINRISTGRLMLR